MVLQAQLSENVGLEYNVRAFVVPVDDGLGSFKNNLGSDLRVVDEGTLSKRPCHELGWQTKDVYPLVCAASKIEGTPNDLRRRRHAVVHTY